MTHPLAGLIPHSNEFCMPDRMASGSMASVLQSLYTGKDKGGGGFTGAFCSNAKTISDDGSEGIADHPQWASKIAEYNKRDFHANTPGTKKYTSDVESTLADGEGESFPNFRYAMEGWDGKGDKPFTRAQRYGDCVDSSRTEQEEALFGYRAAKMPQVNEKFKFASNYGSYGDRGYCGDGWDGGGVAAVTLRTGASPAYVYKSGSNSYDATDEFKTEDYMARGCCRSGRPQWMKDFLHTAHPYEDGAITEFNGDMALARKVFASGGILQTGGTNTSRNSKPCQIGPVGGHEQSMIGGDASEDAAKFMADKAGVRYDYTKDFLCIFSQTWGTGFSGEIADEYWWVGTHNGTIYTQADINNLRGASPKDAADLMSAMAGTGWGEKHEGAWIFLWSQVQRCFGGDIWSWLPRVKGFPSDGPPPLPTPAANPPITGPIWVEGGNVIRGSVTLSLPVPVSGSYDYVVAPDQQNAGKYKLVKKPVA